MTKHKTILKIPTLMIVLTLIVPLGYTDVFADDGLENDFIATTEENIKNNPMLAKILENIEKSKKDIESMQDNESQEKLEEQRRIVKEKLEQELAQMFKDNEEYTPLAAFKKFLTKVSDDNTKTLFQELFNYHQNKVDNARDAMYKVLRNGGTLQEARDAYHEAAKIPRNDMIQLVQDLNIERGFSDPAIQKHFDSEGKLPRYEDEKQSMVSFVDLTSSAKNINSSSNETEVQEITVSSHTDETLNDDYMIDENITSHTDTTIQKLLEEIQVLKNKIKKLENKQDTKIQKVIFEPKNSSIQFASWISDYTQGLGHKDEKIKDERAIPVNALNKPNSHNDVKNSLALGRQGQVTVGFSEPVTGELILYEASKEKHIRELAIIEVSRDGEKWTQLNQVQYNSDGSFVHEYSYDISEIGCISQVRITDNAPSKWGDGFDIDALGATKTCTT